MFIKNIFFEIGQLIYPKLCLGCNAKITTSEKIMCLQCYKNIPLTGNYYLQNATERLLLGRVNILAGSSLLYYQKNGIAQNLMHALKYKSKVEVAEYFGCMLGKHIVEANWALQNAILVPIPLAPKRLQQRGYNQSVLIAQYIATITKLPISQNIIYRAKDTETQTKKSRLQRVQNMHGAFEIQDASIFENKHIIIVDDVITTGATIEACIMAFKNVKNINISVLAAAIASE